MGYWIGGFQPKLLSGKLGPGELGTFRLGQVGRLRRRIRVGKVLPRELGSREHMSGRLGQGSYGSGRPTQGSMTSREIEIQIGEPCTV